VKPLRDYHPRTSLVALENTHNRGGGKLFPERDVAEIARTARELGLALHLDGARLWNASIASGRSLAELAAPFDTVSVCFSKGLGAPVGSALCSTRDAVARARRFRKMLGGGMRQAGILAAAALYALEHHRQRLAQDHEHAALLARELERAGYPLDPAAVETNVVIFELEAGDAAAVVAAVKERGLLVGAVGARRIRAVTHLDVDGDACARAADILAAAVTS
jgi:threonine aldolase